MDLIDCSEALACHAIKQMTRFFRIRTQSVNSFVSKTIRPFAVIASSAAYTQKYNELLVLLNRVLLSRLYVIVATDVVAASSCYTRCTL